MTWEQLTKMEPRLQKLYDRAKGHKPTKGFCAHRAWYGRDGLKAQMLELVGYGAPGALGTPDAYETAYKKIYNALPSCRHEGWC